MTPLDPTLTFTANRRLKISVWAFDGPFLLPGETATVIGYYVGGSNPLYVLSRDRDGKESLEHRSHLEPYGVFS